ncbi:hypothetical protein CBM2586_A11447 [Cupriavidus phytorum]|uniref:Uncharacterized protein n=1 Tax=Cupriavidus taiwanensis TaxID=164546 RepID=A0A375BE89_9BURK|nr:hypothetical protein CBM2586_A11447 [Cupriavidus taiwanensis]
MWLPHTTQVWETWPRGRRHSPAKGASGPKPGSRVRIPPSPPMTTVLGGGTPEDRGLPGFCFFGAPQGASHPIGNPFALPCAAPPMRAPISFTSSFVYFLIRRAPDSY